MKTINKQILYVYFINNIVFLINNKIIILILNNLFFEL